MSPHNLKIFLRTLISYLSLKLPMVPIVEVILVSSSHRKLKFIVIMSHSAATKVGLESGFLKP